MPVNDSDSSIKRSDSAASWILENSRGQRISILVLAIADIAIALCTVYEALALRNIINNAVERSNKAFAAAAWVMVALVASRIVLRILTRWLDERTKAKLENKLKGRLFNALLRKDYASVSAMHSGEWMNRLTNDTVQVANNAAEIVPNALATLVKLVASVLLVMHLVKDVSWIIFPCAAVLILVTVLLRGKMKKLHKRIQEADGRFRSFISDCMSSLLVIRSFSREESVSGTSEERMEEHMSRRMERIRFSNIANTGYQLILEAVYLAAVIYCGYSILTGRMNYGTFTAVITLAGRIQGPVTNMSGYVPRWYSMLASAERLMEAEAFEDDIKGEKKTEGEIAELYGKSLKGLRLRDVSFSYIRTGSAPTDEPKRVVLDGKSLDIDKQSITAITGPSGCGKSTLLKLIMCFYPLNSGERKIFTAEGETALGPEWRGLFAYVPQGNQLMSGPIREVLTFGDASVSADEIYKALDIACASDFVSRLPDGLDTVLGERGSGLSEGQIQRLAIARAVLSGHPFLLLDEATSSLDEDTEKALLQKMRTLTDRTVVIVTHRLNVLSICDTEVHMDEEGVSVRGLGN